MEINLENLSLRELNELNAKVAKAISTYEQRMKKEALQELEDRARAFGFSLSELIAARPQSARPREASLAKYANPSDASETWTGRGRKPGWFIQALEAGKSPEDLLI